MGPRTRPSIPHRPTASPSARRRAGPRRYPLSARRPGRPTRTSPASSVASLAGPAEAELAATTSASSATPAHAKNAWKTCWFPPTAGCPQVNQPRHHPRRRRRHRRRPDRLHPRRRPASRPPAKLVAYFGVLAHRGRQRRGPRRPGLLAATRCVMSRARQRPGKCRYLWMAALSAVVHNPAVSALYALRVVARCPRAQAVAVGHAMRKLLRIWPSPCGRAVGRLTPTTTPGQQRMSPEPKRSQPPTVGSRRGQ